MLKSVFIFTIIIVFVVIAIWFFVQKTKEVNQTIETPTLASASSPQATPTIGEPIRYDNGLIIQDLVIGNGKAAANGDTLSANYVGTLEDGTKFDSSYDRGEPIQFVLGSGQLIKGWELGLVGMKEGGKRKLIVPASLGYGAKGAGNIIPPNATLLFEIELVSIEKPK